MITQPNKAQTIYSRAIQQQNIEKMAFVVITKAEHAAMQESTRLDLEKIATAAGVEMLKTARVAMRRDMRQQQEAGLKELNKLLQEIKTVKECKDVAIQAGIATGYANAMQHFNLMSEGELKDVIEVIGQVAEKATCRIKDTRAPFLLKIFRRQDKR